MNKKLLDKIVNLIKKDYDNSKFPYYINLCIDDPDNARILYRQDRYLTNPPALYTMEVLEYLKSLPEEVVITSKHLMQKYGITNVNASVRLQRLRKWGFLKYYNRGEQAKGGYILTDYGKYGKIPR